MPDENESTQASLGHANCSDSTSRTLSDAALQVIIIIIIKTVKYRQSERVCEISIAHVQLFPKTMAILKIIVLARLFEIKQ